MHALARRGPVPAAGCAAAATLAQGIALGLLAVRVTRARPSTGNSSELSQAESQLSDLLPRALALIDDDAAAVRDWMAHGARTTSTTYDIAGDGDPNVEVPLRMLSLAATACDALLPVAPLVVHDLRSEVGAAAALIRGGAQSAALIVRNNTAGAAARGLGRDFDTRVHQLTATVERGFTALWSQANSPDRPGPS